MKLGSIFIDSQFVKDQEITGITNFEIKKCEDSMQNISFSYKVTQFTDIVLQ